MWLGGLAKAIGKPQVEFAQCFGSLQGRAADDEQIAVEPEVVSGEERRVHLHDLLQVVFARCGRLDEIEVLAFALHEKTRGHGCSFRGLSEASVLAQDSDHRLFPLPCIFGFARLATAG